MNLNEIEPNTIVMARVKESYKGTLHPDLKKGKEYKVCRTDESRWKVYGNGGKELNASDGSFKEVFELTGFFGNFSSIWR